MRVIAIANHKGGSGKTTVAVNLAYGLAAAGRRVLLVDLDPQGNAGVGLGLDIHAAPRTVAGLLTERHPVLRDYVMPARPNLDVIVSNLDAAALETELISRLNRERLLLGAMQADGARGDRDGGGYDDVVIDTPPSLGLLTVNALVASQLVIVVVDCGFYALYGLKRLEETVELIAEGFERELEVRALVNNYDRRQNIDRDVVEQVRRTFGERAYQTVIRRNVKLKEAQSAGEAIQEYSPASTGAADFESLAGELARKAPRRNQASRTTRARKAGVHG